MRSATRPLEIDAPARVKDNVFDQPAPPTGSLGAAIEIGTGAGSPVVVGNVVIDPDPTDVQAGIYVHSSESPEISYNVFADLNSAVIASGGGGTPVILGNRISGTHSNGADGTGVLVRDQVATVLGNAVVGSDPSATGEAGFRIEEGAGAAATGAILRRDTADGLDLGIDVADTEGAVIVDSDLLVRNGIGLQARRTSGAPGAADVSAANLTVFDSTSNSSLDIRSLNNQLTLDSSIVGDGVATSGELRARSPSLAARPPRAAIAKAFRPPSTPRSPTASPAIITLPLALPWSTPETPRPRWEHSTSMAGHGRSTEPIPAGPGATSAPMSSR